MTTRPFSVEVTDKPVKGEGPIRRNRVVAQTDLLAKPRESVSTVYELIQYSVKKYGDKHALGHRNVLEEHVEEKMITKMVNGQEQQVPKKWTFWELSPYQYRSFKEFGEESAALGAGLRNLGLKTGDRVELYAGTSYVSFFRAVVKFTNALAGRVGNLWLRGACHSPCQL